MCRYPSASLGAKRSPVSSARPAFSMSAYRKAIGTRFPLQLHEHDSAGPPLSATFNHQLLEFSSVDPARLRDTHALSGLVVAAAGAVGMPSLGPPVVREGAEGCRGPALSQGQSCSRALTRGASWSRYRRGPRRRQQRDRGFSRQLGRDAAAPMIPRLSGLLQYGGPRSNVFCTDGGGSSSGSIRSLSPFPLPRPHRISPSSSARFAGLPP